MKNNKEYLLNRNYTNTSIEVLPFKENFEPIKVLEKLTKNVATIDANTLKTADEKTMINKVFAGFGLPNDVTKDTIDDALLQAVKFGNNKNVQRITISDGALKIFVPGMVSFLEMYYGEFTGKLKSFEDKTLGNLETFFQLTNLAKGKADENDRLLDNLSLATSLIRSGIGSVRLSCKEIAREYLDLVNGLSKDNPNRNGKKEK